MKLLTIILALMFVVGCGANRDKKEETAKEVVTDTVRTITQYDKMVAGQKAKNKIKKIDQDHQDDVNEVVDGMY